MIPERHFAAIVSTDVWRRCLRLVKNPVEDMLPHQINQATEHIAWVEIRAKGTLQRFVEDRIRVQAAEYVEARS